jgi:flavin-dependent dehydrogenase
MLEKSEVAVIGGGPAGACAASTLAGLGVSTLLVETRRDPLRKAGETLAASAGSILNALGVWDVFAAAGHLPCHGNVSAWGHDGWQENDFMLQGLGSAWQLDRPPFEESLISAAARAGATIVRGNELTEIVWENGRWRFSAGGRTFCTGYVIDATGRRSMVARNQGVRRNILDLLVAVHGVANGGNGTDRDSRTFIESCPDGWWYSALVPGNKRIVSFQTDADLLPRDVWRTREWLVERLEQAPALSSLLRKHGYELIGAPRLTSAHSGRLPQFSGRGWLAVGDAAMSFDPLSGQGILHAMQSGTKAGQMVASGCARSRAEMDSWYERLWEEFFNRRRTYYSVEQRWCDAIFWKRRSSDSAAGG